MRNDIYNADWINIVADNDNKIGRIYRDHYEYVIEIDMWNGVVVKLQTRNCKQITHRTELTDEIGSVVQCGEVYRFMTPDGEEAMLEIAAQQIEQAQQNIHPSHILGTPMPHIRPATPADASRIAEIIITNYRTNFYPFFRNDPFYFGELNVVDMASSYAEGTEVLRNSYVYDDGVVKGIIRISGDEIEKLFVEPQFQSQGIGAKLLDFAVNHLNGSQLWVLEYNKRGIAFYQRHGFTLTGEKIMEDEWVPLLKMERRVKGESDV